MKINVEFNSLSDMVSFADFISNRADINSSDNKRKESEAKLAIALEKIEALKARLTDVGYGNVLDMTIDHLEMSMRSTNCLTYEKMKTVEDLISKSAADLKKIPNFGKESLREVRETLAKLNLKLKGD